MNNRIFPNSNSKSIKPRSLRGKLLVATNKLSGTPFEKAVIFLLQDDQQSGTFGVALNRPADENVKQTWRQMSGSPEHVVSQLVHGGPVGGPVFAIHKYESLAEVEMPGDIFISAKAEAIQQLYDQAPETYRIFLGIAGWKTGQLDSEIHSGLWHVMESDPEDIFDDNDWLWERSMFRYGEQALCDVLGISIDDLPMDPSLN